MKLLLVFHSINQNSGMENLLLGIKKHSEISVTILYTDYICESIQNNFVCLKFETATKNHIESHDLLIFFKEYRKSFDFTKIVFKNIKKICAVFHPIELNESCTDYNFHLIQLDEIRHKFF